MGERRPGAGGHPAREPAPSHQWPEAAWHTAMGESRAPAGWGKLVLRHLL